MFTCTFGFVGVLGVGLLLAHEVHDLGVAAVFSGCMSVASST